MFEAYLHSSSIFQLLLIISADTKMIDGYIFPSIPFSVFLLYKRKLEFHDAVWLFIGVYNV